MRNKRFKYEATFPCTCAGGRAECGVIGIVTYPEFGNVEIGFSTRKERYQGNTKNPHIFLDQLQVQILMNKLKETLAAHDKIVKESKKGKKK